MGMFEVKVKLASLATPMQTEELSLLVDSGATLSWIPRSTLEGLGVAPYSHLPFVLADGRRLERDISAVLLMIDERKAPIEKKLLPRDLMALNICARSSTALI